MRIAELVSTNTCAVKWVRLVMAALNKGRHLDALERVEVVVCELYNCEHCACNGKHYIQRDKHVF